MRVPLSWLRDHAALPDVDAREVGAALIRAGLEVETIERVGADVRGVVVGRVLDFEELPGLRKPIRFCQVDVGEVDPRGIVCGAVNFTVGVRVAVALPGAVLPGGVQIGSRKAYGRISDGMVCSARELGLGEDHAGILVLDDSFEVGVEAADALHLRDDVLDMSVTADRGYCWSIRGIAREAAIAFRVPFTDPADVAVASPDRPGYEVRIEDRVGCDRYVARVVTGLDPAAQTPLELRRRLLLAGMRPISLAVDVTNLALLGLGQPMHAFDRARLTGPIVVRRAGAGERLTTLDGVDRALDPDDLLITDGSGPIALAGVMGGGPTEVSPDTTDLLLESAHFEPATVARSVRRHRLPTEAAKRWERGVDDALAPAAAEIAVRLLVEHGGGKATAGSTDVDARPPREVIRLSPGLPARVAGRPYAEEVVRARLADVGCSVAEAAGQLTVTPPSWRGDLTRPIDLADEVIRLEGYDTVPAEVPRAPAGRGLTGRQQRLRALAHALAGAGFVETPTDPFLGPAALDALGLPVDDVRRRTLRLVNPLDDTEPDLRTTLLPGLCRAAARNASRGFPDLALWETGPVVRPRPDARPAPRPPGGIRPPDEVLAALDAALPDQPLHLAVVLTGRREPTGWWGVGRQAGWADAVQAARLTGRTLGLDLDAAAARLAPWHPGRCAEMRIDGVVVGAGGELHPRVVEAYGLPSRAVALEIDLEPLLRLAPDARPAPVVSRQPVATLDVSLVVADDVPVAAVATALQDGGGPLLESVRLFDVYTGPQAGEGRKSLAFALRLRAPDRTLTADETRSVRDNAVSSAAARTGAVLRAG